ncbi:MAG: type I restriction enzyme HsdR N-terminal domain-containing protein [Bacteroidota bacterium]|nr:type I restriction enzyme HsdR N-terminal domain-containing protein [Bacteroidota bacterium]|tara:strand:+ start:620 stop:1063 length:444 start_codon:yes stop_codon:yes gene_type:complete
MINLNIPDQNIKLQTINSKTYVFDFLRKKKLILTPEEWVRQNLVSHLVNDLNYPKGLIKTESSLKYNKLNKRADIIVLDRNMNNFMVIECKSYKLNLNKSNLNQAAIYNKIYRSRYLMLSNGIKHVICEYNWDDESFIFLDSIPKYN